MVGNTRAELDSSNLDGPPFGVAYTNGQRGAFSGAGLDRSGSFREGLESRGLTSGPNGSRNGAQLPLTHFLNQETYSLGEQKYTRYNELRRVLGVSLEEQHSFSSLQSKPLPSMASEEVKCFRLSLQDSSSRARDRRKAMNESLMKLDKYRTNALKKQQRNDAPTSEKPGSSTLLKMGGPIHQNPLDPGSQRMEERTKNAVPNKRAWSSVSLPYLFHPEGRSSISMRPSAVTDKDKCKLFENNKSMLRTCNGVSMPYEDKDHGLPAVGDGWERRLKRKRTVGIIVNKVSDGDRELKQPIQQRPNVDPSSRSSDGIGLRHGRSNIIIGANKTDPSYQSSGASSRVISKHDMDNGSLPSDSKECSSGPDKERILAKGSNKLNVLEDAQVGSQSSLAKGKPSRAPRTSSGVVMNTASIFPRSSGGVDGWEHASGPNKLKPLTGGPIRNRSFPTGPSSSPVAQWVGQRPQKSSRSRRANVVSPVPEFEGHETADLVSRLTTTESNGVLLPSAQLNNAHQSKLMLENASSPACILGSEESGAIDSKSKEKGTENGDVEDGALNVVHKAPPSGFPAKKNKISLKEEVPDGVRRQGRSGRGSIQTKACLPLPKEKLENMVIITKPLKSGRPGSSDRSASRVGRPPSKKASDRKSYVRSGQIVNSNPSDLTGESADDREELLAAANAARGSSFLACSSSYWEMMEPGFSFASLEDINYVNNQISFAADLEESMCNMPDGDLLFKKMSLSQRLLSAFVAEDDSETLDCIIGQGDGSSQFSSNCSPNLLNSHVEDDPKTDVMKSEFELDLGMKLTKSNYADAIPCNGYTGSNNFRSPDIQNFISGDEPLEGNLLVNTDTGNFSEFEQNKVNPLRLTNTGFLGGSPSEGQFEHMSLDGRILLELQSIGLFIEPVPDLSAGEGVEIDKEVSELKTMLYQQVKTKKNQMLKLETNIQESKLIEERNLEQLAMNKLIEMSYKKLSGGRGSQSSSHKSGARKAAKQLALAFAKRTLSRCRKFEETGRSCFRDAPFHNVLFSADGISSQTTANVDAHSCQLVSRASGSGTLASGVVSMGERPELIHKLDRVKKIEVLLEDVVTNSTSRAITLSHTSPSGVKWKRTEKERDQNTVTRTTKAARPSLTNGRSERKTRKPKQKIAQLSTSGNGLGPVTETSISVLTSMRESRETVNSGGTRVNQEHDLSKEMEDSMFTSMPLHAIDSIDELVEADGLGGQGQDIGSWLSVDDIALEEDGIGGGLDIPMDDLSGLKLDF